MGWGWGAASSLRAPPGVLQVLLIQGYIKARIFSSAEGTTQTARSAQKKELHEARQGRGHPQHSLPLTPRTATQYLPALIGSC
ncbi:hypothetical protein GRJ2_002487100 [Grus japonensis]|uniref:Uncharacterized protein n=1 Tax=Grus japonensis TaxID=30415 RepID=A0ABC9XUK9_GRUJA